MRIDGKNKTKTFSYVKTNDPAHALQMAEEYIDEIYN